jgi:hypothetical protein
MRGRSEYAESEDTYAGETGVKPHQRRLHECSIHASVSKRIPVL